MQTLSNRRQYVELCLTYYMHRSCYIIDRFGKKVPITFFNWGNLDICTRIELLEGILSECQETAVLDSCLIVSTEKEKGKPLHIPLSFQERWLPIAMTGCRQRSNLATEIYNGDFWELLLVDLEDGTKQMPLYKIDSMQLKCGYGPQPFERTLAQLHIAAY